jgi:hypothetical protein
VVFLLQGSWLLPGLDHAAWSLQPWTMCFRIAVIIRTVEDTVDPCFLPPWWFIMPSDTQCTPVSGGQGMLTPPRYLWPFPYEHFITLWHLYYSSRMYSWKNNIRYLHRWSNFHFYSGHGCSYLSVRQRQISIIVVRFFCEKGHWLKKGSVCPSLRFVFPIGIMIGHCLQGKMSHRHKDWLPFQPLLKIWTSAI